MSNLLYNLSNIEYCYQYVINQIPVDLLLYAHIPTALVAILFGFYIILHNRSVASVSLFYVCVGFALWSILNLITWFVFIGAPETMFAWSLIDLVGLIFFFFAYRFLYAYITGNELPTWQIVFGLLLILPTALTTLLGLNLTSFDANICEATENASVVIYTYIAQCVFIVATLRLGVNTYTKASNTGRRTEIFIATAGVSLFLIFFFLVNFLVLLLISSDAVEYAYNFGIYGLFGMPVLLVMLGYLIVKYKAFEIKLVAAQALMAALVATVVSMFFFAQSSTNFVLIAVSLFLVSVGGYFLVKSVKKEIKQREEIEELAKKLERANERLKELDKMKSEFVSIASHQLRSPLTSIKGYASMLVEGSYGTIPERAKEILDKIVDSSRFMALSIEDYLNVSRIEAGNMKYEYTTFDLQKLAQTTVEDMRQAAVKKSLVLSFTSEHTDPLMVRADIGKTKQVITNLIDNSIKYTPKGIVQVSVQHDKAKNTARVVIEDSGVGMSPDTLGGLFDKFVRAKNANSINVTGTGLGLYVARIMVTQMGGNIWAESDGEGRGSRFIVEFPVV